jgi:hypothetical protein
MNLMISHGRDLLPLYVGNAVLCVCLRRPWRANLAPSLRRGFEEDRTQCRRPMQPRPGHRVRLVSNQPDLNLILVLVLGESQGRLALCGRPLLPGIADKSRSQNAPGNSLFTPILEAVWLRRLKQSQVHSLGLMPWACKSASEPVFVIFATSPSRLASRTQLRGPDSYLDADQT